MPATRGAGRTAQGQIQTAPANEPGRGEAPAFHSKPNRAASGRQEPTLLRAGGLAHDINNLLAAIGGYVQFAQAEAPPESALSGYLADIRIATERAGELARQMLPQANEDRTAPEPIDLRKLARETVRLLRPLIPASIEIECRSAPGLPITLGDGAQLRRIVMNLVLNAADAIGQHPGRLLLCSGVVRPAARRAAEMGLDWALPYAFLEVVDSGRGMDIATQQRIFDPAFTTKKHGRGLGLATVQRIVAAHGGAIAVNSTPGQGSRFRVLLPALTLAKRVNPAGATQPATQRMSGKILVVDDDLGVRGVTCRYLESLGFQTLQAEDGASALRAFAAHSDAIRLVLLDLTMPQMSGGEVLREIRRRDPQALVILTSGYAKRDVAADLAGTSVDAFLQKPYRLDELRAQVQRVLQLPSRQATRAV